MKAFVVLASTILLLFSACKKSESDYKPIVLAELKTPKIQEHPGKKLMETYCYTCHSPTAEMKEMIAPPMAGVKAHYLLNDPSKEEFIQAFVSFVEEPSVEKSKIPGAIKRFGLMPYQEFPESSLEQIAEYIYEFKIEEPQWFEEHWKGGPGKGSYKQRGLETRPGKGMGNSEGMGNPKKMGTPKGLGPGKAELLSPATTKSHSREGMEIALETKQLLGKNLMGALQKKGAEHALEFCNLNALLLTDSVAAKHDVKIQRISDKPRNPLNAATGQEEALIRIYQKKIAEAQDPQPVLKPDGDNFLFYYPIVTNDMCLQCHGKEENISPSLQAKILKLYPEDKATGYSENEVRGLWRITLPK